MPERIRTRDLPTGTLTFLFSDIEGSTRLVQALGTAFPQLLERQQALVREAIAKAHGIEVATEGDSFFVVFPSTTAAVNAAAAVQRAMAAEPWPADAGTVRVRIGLHTGEGTLGGDNYVGVDVHRAARIGAAAHGGQVLLSDATRALVAASLGSGLSLRDLGEHRLKDLNQPERLAQLVIEGLPDEFPPPRSLEAPTNLPSQMTTFIGRRREAEELGELVARSRLVTLTGPGGTGKTRLSIQVATQARESYPSGAFFVDLSPITDPDLIPSTITAALGLRPQPNKPVLESLLSHLRDLRLLLVLDNFEQVESGAPLVGHLLEAAAGLTVVVTSREVLHLRGEQEYPVPPLTLPNLASLPALDALSQYDAVALFIQRAQAVRPDFAVDNQNAPAVAAICARLDGLPLAIELAAARVKVLAPDAILARLEKSLSLLTSASRDLTERQRTLRGAIDWSHDILDELERTLFRRLGIFVGGWTIESADAICNPSGELGIDMLDGLSSLVDKSLVKQTAGIESEPRFGMLETIREYAMERLSASEDARQIREAHAAHFATIAAQAATGVMGTQQKDWLDRLDSERDNLRAALQHLGEDGHTSEALDMGADLWRFWQMRGHHAEGRAALEGLLDRPEASAPNKDRARALAGLGGIIYWQGDMAKAKEVYAEELAVERSIDDPPGLAEALYNLGFVAAVTKDHEAARRYYEGSLEIYSRLQDEASVLRVKEALVFQLFHAGSYEEARELQEANVARFRETGEAYRLANGLSLLAGVLLRLGAYPEARARQAEAIRLFNHAGDMQALVRILIVAAAIAVGQGELERAAKLRGAADRLKEPLGEIALPMSTLSLEDPAIATREGLGDEAYERAYQEGRALTTDEAIALVG